MKPFINKLLLICAACSLAGCAVGPDYHTPKMDMPAGFDAAGGTSAAAAAQWWEGMNDKELDALVSRAVTANPDLEIALDRLQEARLQEAAVLGGALPAVGLSAGGARGSGSDLASGRAAPPLVAAETTATGVKQVNQIAGFDAAWELDLFGKYRREMEAAKYQTEAARAARNAVLVSVIADVAHAYVDMRALQTRLVVLQKNIGTMEDYVTVTQERYNRGITNELDLSLAQREAAELKAEEAPLTAQIKAAQYVIATLLGQFPEQLSAELSRPAMIPALPEKIDTGMPIDLLRRRPDIQEADRDAATATAHIGVATADLFPHVSLTAGVGTESQGFGLSPAMSKSVWSVGPTVGWSLLDFGTLDALVRASDMQARGALANYKLTVLNAVREVDTSLNDYAAEQSKLRELDKAMEASQRAVSIATQRYDRGLTDSLNVIDAERQEYALEDQYVTSQQHAAEEFIALYKALGGGWEAYDTLPALQKPRPAVVAAFGYLVSPDDPQKK